MELEVQLFWFIFVHVYFEASCCKPPGTPEANCNHCIAPITYSRSTTLPRGHSTAKYGLLIGVDGLVTLSAFIVHPIGLFRVGTGRLMHRNSRLHKHSAHSLHLTPTHCDTQALRSVTHIHTHSLSHTHTHSLTHAHIRTQTQVHSLVVEISALSFSLSLCVCVDVVSSLSVPSLLSLLVL